MANRELPIHIRQLYQKLKQKFPDVPDNVIFKYAKMYPDDIQKCIDYLNEHKNMQIEDENRTVGNKNQLPDSYNSYIQGSVLINQAPFQLPNNGIVEGHAGINGISSLPYITVQGTGTNAAYHSKYGHSPGARSSSVSGATLMPPTTSEYRSSVTGTQSQSAPVMPSHYEPFQMEYKGHAEVSFKPTLIRSPGQISFTPISTHRFPQSHEIYYEQLNRQHLPYSQYKYEMRVQYNQALIQCQQAQMAKLREHLMGEKQKLDLIKSDVYALEEELQKRKRCLQNPIIPLDIIEQLREETRKLRIECDTMSKEVDSLVKGKVPLGETRMDFYESINPGQVGNVGIPLNRQERSSKALSSVSLPPPPPPLIRNEDEDRQWSCSTCTFLNNIALDKCEICDMPRLSLASNFT